AVPALRHATDAPGIVVCPLADDKMLSVPNESVIHGCQRRNHYETRGECYLFALDHQCARRSRLVHWLGCFELHPAVSLHYRSRAADSDGGAVGHPDRRTARLRHFFSHLLRSHGTKKSRAAALGLAALFRDWTRAGTRGRRLSLLLRRCALGLLPPRQTALRFHGALQEEEWRSRTRRQCARSVVAVVRFQLSVC